MQLERRIWCLNEFTNRHVVILKRCRSTGRARRRRAATNSTSTFFTPNRRCSCRLTNFRGDPERSDALEGEFVAARRRISRFDYFFAEGFRWMFSL